MKQSVEGIALIKKCDIIYDVLYTDTTPRWQWLWDYKDDV